ncbi:hypothetical protein A374_10480 [Fictibacillus macauensis ZFHKF-1]|uniref:Cytosolic protein n=1 Tax=Fictibacillus macauensis ZFHKF-1 TaxID=1196324 RepID=I8AHH1_9BACL|nr:YqgQ family protein [Fictibacillus macauensis]EIT85162.1 hypothetical protein A374_10480 [Fictibacillus macauensis ZFHKF-1]
MKTVYDVQQLLKRYGIFVYTGHPKGDLELMQEELRGLYDMRLITIADYQKAVLILRANVRLN